MLLLLSYCSLRFIITLIQLFQSSNVDLSIALHKYLQLLCVAALLGSCTIASCRSGLTVSLAVTIFTFHLTLASHSLRKWSCCCYGCCCTCYYRCGNRWCNWLVHRNRNALWCIHKISNRDIELGLVTISITKEEWIISKNSGRDDWFVNTNRIQSYLSYSSREFTCSTENGQYRSTLGFRCSFRREGSIYYNSTILKVEEFVGKVTETILVGIYTCTEPLCKSLNW